MSGRIRQLKPDVFLDEELWALGEANPGLHLLQAFEGLWCHSDREGRFEWRPARLKTQILPYWSGDFGLVLDALLSAGYLVRYEVAGRVFGWVRTFLKHQRPGNREPVSVIPAPPESAQVCSSKEKSAEATRGTLSIPLSIPQPPDSSSKAEPDVDPPSVPGLTRVVGAGCVSRVFDMPCQEPPPEYLQEATMAAVTQEQARSTWAWYWSAGLPEKGVRRLFEWLLMQAKDRANRQAKLPPKSGTAFRGPALTIEPTEKHRRFAAKFGIDLPGVIKQLIDEGAIDSVGLGRAKEMIGERMSMLARKQNQAPVGAERAGA